MKPNKCLRPTRLKEQGEGRQGGASRLTTSAMIAALAAPGQRTKAAPFCQGLATLAETRPEIVGLTADLGKYTDLQVFAKAHPDRFYQMDLSEQLLNAGALPTLHDRHGISTSAMVRSMKNWLPA